MSTCARRSAMAAVREVDEGHVHVESFVLSVDAEDQQLLAPLGQGFSAALAGARPTAAAVAPATAARRDTTMGMRNALAAARTARRTDRKNMLCERQFAIVKSRLRDRGFPVTPCMAQHDHTATRLQPSRWFPMGQRQSLGQCLPCHVPQRGKASSVDAWDLEA